MLNENLKELRKSKGISQEELAVQLKVVRQTISKWEKGLSVPDADMLRRIAEIFEVSVSQLLGEKENQDTHENNIADQLEQINEQLVIKNRRSRMIWKIIAGIAIGFVVINIFLIILSVTAFKSYENVTVESQTEIIDSVE